jgi:hypothetical protein
MVYSFLSLQHPRRDRGGSLPLWMAAWHLLGRALLRRTPGARNKTALQIPLSKTHHLQGTQLLEPTL